MRQSGQRSLILMAVLAVVLVAAAGLLWSDNDADGPGGNAAPGGTAQQAPNINRSEVDNPVVTIRSEEHTS